MYGWKSEMRAREQRLRNPPTFSSILLDEIYRSLADGELDPQELKARSQTKCEKVKFSAGLNNKSARSKIGDEEEREIMTLRRACLIEKWMDQKVRDKVIDQRKKKPPVFDYDLDRDSVLFSSTSSSSDSSSGGLFSDSDSFHGAKSWPPSHQSLKPIKTGGGVLPRSKKTETLLSKEQGRDRVYDDCCHRPGTERPLRPEEVRITLKSKASKIYNDIKKAKQPISPGGRLATFINSLFQGGSHSKKQVATTPSFPSVKLRESRNSRITEEPVCSSASSFSRSCLSKKSPATREKLRNGIKRNVSFYPGSVTVNEDCKQIGNKNPNAPPESSNGLIKSNSVSLPNTCRTGPRETAASSSSTRFDQVKENRFQRSEPNDITVLVKGNANADKCKYRNLLAEHDDVDDDDGDAHSCASSDLFELDHLAVVNRYREELPVYETTRVGANRVIANMA